MTTYEKQREDARKKCNDMRDRFHKEFERIFDETMESDSINYIFSITGSVKISKEKFDTVLEKIKDPEVKEDVFDSWIRVLKLIHWKVELADEKYIFSKNMR